MPFMELMGKIGLDGSAFSAGVAQVEKGALKMSTAFNNAVKGAAKNRLVQAFGAAALVSSTKSVIDYGSKINDLSARLGVSAEGLQQWNYAATQSGATAEDVSSFFEKLAVSRGKAFGGDSGAIKSFKELGVSLEDLKGFRIEDIGEKIGKMFESGDPQKLIGSLREVGGKGAGGLISAFKDGLDDSFSAASKLGLVMEDSVVSQLDEMGDSLDRFISQMRGPVASAVIEVSKTFLNITDAAKVWASFWGGVAGGQGGISSRLDAGAKAGWDAVNESVERDAAAEKERVKKKASKEYQPPTDAVITPEKTKKTKAEEEKENRVVDSLAKIGGFTLGQDSSILNIQKQQLSVLEEIEKNTAVQFDDGL